MKTLAFAFSVCILVSGATASATGRFPAGIQKTLALSYTPPCALCHTSGSTGPGTARTPFALAAKARGLIPNDQASLDHALAQMKADDVDSDGDGVSDIDELALGTDPNTPAATSMSDVPTGCGNSPRRADGPTPTTGIAMAISVLLSRRRDRRKR
jgi:hypothetical protein